MSCCLPRSKGVLGDTDGVREQFCFSKGSYSPWPSDQLLILLIQLLLN